LGDEGTRLVVPEAVEDPLMKHAVRAVIAVALGAGLAAAAQAQITGQQPSTAPATQMQSTAPSSTMQSTPPASTMESTAPQKQQRHAKAQKLSKGQKQIRQVQLRLKSEGLFRGKLTGKMDRQTRIALAREQDNGMARSGSSMQRTRTAHLGKKQPIHTAHMTRHAPKSQTTGVGSSMPNTKNTAGTAATSPAPAGAGGTTSTAPSTTTTTQPSTSPAKK
jgi:hypothetical protein